MPTIRVSGVWPDSALVIRITRSNGQQEVYVIPKNALHQFQLLDVDQNQLSQLFGSHLTPTIEGAEMGLMHILDGSN